MSKAEGEFLGSAEQLIQRLEVSRPTLRQASAQLIQEGLIEIRFGMGGGYYARVPGSASVSRIAAIYLKSHHTRFDEAIRVIEPLHIEMVKLAIDSEDNETRSKLSKFLSEDGTDDSIVDYDAFLKNEQEFGRILGALSGNRMLTLFLQILYDFSALLRRGDDMFQQRSPRLAAYRDMRSQLARAVMNRDKEIAIVLARRYSALVNAWLKEDFG